MRVIYAYTYMTIDDYQWAFLLQALITRKEKNIFFHFLNSYQNERSRRKWSDILKSRLKLSARENKEAFNWNLSTYKTLSLMCETVQFINPLYIRANEKYHDIINNKIKKAYIIMKLE